MSTIDDPKFPRRDPNLWAKVLSDEVAGLSKRQFQSHLAAALKDMQSWAEKEERERCAEFLEDMIVLMIGRYMLIGGDDPSHPLARAAAELEGRRDTNRKGNGN